MERLAPAPYAVVDLSAIAGNVRELRRITSPSARLLVAVKADGYGHGAARVARTALANGADALGVARIEEGIALRREGIAAPILVFGPCDPQAAPELAAYRLTASVTGIDGARALVEHLPPAKQVTVHVKVDTGMGRLGRVVEEDPQAAVEEIAAIVGLPGLVVEGIFTHFAASDSADKTSARDQFRRFRRLLRHLETAGIRPALRHAANSGAIIDMPETHLDMVRAGIAVYGLYPSDQVDTGRIALTPAMTLASRIIQLKQVPAGFAVSYGSTWRAPAPTTIATVAVGYADGYSRTFSNKGIMLVRGRRVPVVGRVCMDLTMLDVGKVPDARVGDEVVIVGRQGDAHIGADELAALVGTINYEIVSSLTQRVVRIYR